MMQVASTESTLDKKEETKSKDILTNKTEFKHEWNRGLRASCWNENSLKWKSRAL